MMQNIDLSKVKQYNTSLKQYKEQAARLNAEIEVNEKNLLALCQQLTLELGVQVTPENIEAIYSEQLQKLQQILDTGTAILSKIEQESSTQSLTQVNNTIPASTPVITAPVTPVAQTPVAPAPAQVTPAPAMGNSFVNAFGAQPISNVGTLNSEQPLFNI